MSKTAIEFDVRMTRDEYRNWAEHQSSRRFERVSGIVVTMAPERAEHNLRKRGAWPALSDAVHKAGLRCEVCTDGMTVEVLSPSTASIDRARKFNEYFQLPSLRHYCLIWADKRQVVHHRLDDAGEIQTQTVIGGEISLDLPGVAIAIDDIYAE